MAGWVRVLAVAVVLLAGCARGPAEGGAPAPAAPATTAAASEDEPDESEDETEDSGDSDSEDSGDSGEGDSDAAEGEEVSVFRVRPGDCFDDPEGAEIREVVVISCDEPHDNEVYALVELDDDDDYPGENQVVDEAEELCFEAFEDYVGIPYEESIFLSLQLTPTEEGWEEGDREAVCVLYDADQDSLDESAEGAEE